MAPLEGVVNKQFFFEFYLATAIRQEVHAMSETNVAEVAESSRVKRPDWLRVKLPTGESFRKVREIVERA